MLGEGQALALRLARGPGLRTVGRGAVPRAAMACSGSGDPELLCRSRSSDLDLFGNWHLYQPRLTCSGSGDPELQMSVASLPN